MKKFILIFIIMLSFSLFAACGKDDKKDEKVDSISVVETSIPSKLHVNDLDSKLSDIKIEVVKGESKEEVSLKKDMISDSDLEKLNNRGEYEVTVSYKGQTASLKLTIVNDNYSVKVVYPDGTVASGNILAKWCTETTCLIPKKVQDNGYAEMEPKYMVDDLYYIHIENVPAGYTYDPNIYTTTKDNKDVVVDLIKLSTIEEGKGSKEEPYKVLDGAYALSFDKTGVQGALYFSFTASESKEYTIGSLSDNLSPKGVVDPYLGFYGSDLTFTSNPDTKGNIDKVLNFTYKFTAVKGETYTFAIFVSSAVKPTGDALIPAEFDFIVK